MSSQDWPELDLLLPPKRYSSCVIITDENIAPHFVAALQKQLENSHLLSHVITLAPGEQSKTLEAAEICWTKMMEYGLDRKSLVIGLGGGAITDLAGYVAGCFMRGIDVIFLPTTLLGMVDASIGGKCGVNLGGKNIIGVIHHPKYVLIAPECLITLPDREFRAGLAEVIKYGVIWDEDFFQYIEENVDSILRRIPKVLNAIIQRSCQIKSEIVENDEREHNHRAILNWGHTFAHALEALTQYSIYLHGEAVSIGMSCAAQVSHELGYVDKSFIKRQDALCQKCGLPTALPEISLDRMLHYMSLDKKAVSGKISLIVSRGFGDAMQIHSVDPELIRKALEKKSEVRSQKSEFGS